MKSLKNGQFFIYVILEKLEKLEKWSIFHFCVKMKIGQKLSFLHTDRKSQIVSKNSKFRKIQNCEFEFLVFKCQGCFDNLNFRAKNRDIV